MADREPIGYLLRLADPGPELPPGGALRIRAAAFEVWQRTVRARARRRTAIGAAVMAAAAAAIAIVLFFPRTITTPAIHPQAVARVELVRGIINSGLQQNPIVAGTTLQTGATGRAALRLPGGQSLRLDTNTNVRVISAQLVVLQSGAIYIDSGAPHAPPVEVQTRFGTVRELGTQFEVRAEDALGVAVREGSVGVSTRLEHFHLPAGYAATVRVAGTHEVRTLGASDANWSSSIAPPFQIEGRTVADLLAWCSRETSLTIRYRDAETEQIARTTRLHGAPIDDARPDDAAATILPTAGLAAQRRGDALIVVRQR